MLSVYQLFWYFPQGYAFLEGYIYLACQSESSIDYLPKIQLTMHWENLEKNCKSHQQKLHRVKVHASGAQNIFCMKS